MTKWILFQPVKDALQKESEAALPATAPPVGMPRRHAPDFKFPKPPPASKNNANQSKPRPKSAHPVKVKSKLRSRPGTARR